MNEQLAPGAQMPEGFIPLSVPELRGNEWKYVKECLDTNWVSSVGPFVDRFEQMVADYVGRKYAIATTSGTAALQVALLVAGVQPGDEVLIPALTFIASANAIRYLGAWPVFMDVESHYWQIDPQIVSDFLEKKCGWSNGALYNKSTRRRVKAILPVHILGHPADLGGVVDVARKYDLTVIEDAAEGLGAKYRPRGGQWSAVGALGDLACLSFNGNKIITTGGGGMIVTNDEAWARRAKYLTTQAKDDPLEYIHKEIGYNFRLTNVQAALGCAQMERLEEYVTIKRRIAQTYNQSFSETSGIAPMLEAPWAFSTFWLYTILINQEKFGSDSRVLLHHLGKTGIQARPLWQPLHLSEAHREAGDFRCPNAEALYRQALSLPCSVSLTPQQQDRVISAIQCAGQIPMTP